MAQHTILLKTTGPQPDPCQVAHGDTVVFELDSSWDATVTVSFPNGSPLGVSSFQVSPVHTTSTQSVASSARKDHYPYEAASQDKESVSGELEVVTDPPEEDR
jgi:hypothetical protein